MELENALAAAGQLRDALAAEVERARNERQLLRTLDAGGLFARAAERSRFLAEAARLERELAGAVARAAGTTGPTIARLRERTPGKAEALALALSEVRSLAAALHEIDGLNQQLAQRALACVRGYVEAVRPTPCAYDRRGRRAGAPTLAVVSSKG